MSDKKEKQIFNNLTRVDFKKKSEDIISNYFLSKTEVHSILSVNFGNFSEKWFKFLTAWTYLAYKSFKDMDKYLILIFLIRKTLKHYLDIAISYNYETFYNEKNQFEIEKINLIEIADELKIPKETIRRKINELEVSGLIKRQGKKIFVTRDAFKYQKPEMAVKEISNYLSLVSKYLSTQDWFGESKSSENLENFIKHNFTRVWVHWLNFIIGLCVRQRFFYGDLETYIVSGTVYVNQASRLKKIYIDQQISDESKKFNDYGEKNYIKWLKKVVNSKEKILGINASSVSEITGIPRATVIRKLRLSEKRGLIIKNKDQLYTIGKKTKTHLKTLIDLFAQNQISLSKFITIFFEIYKNKQISK